VCLASRTLHVVIVLPWVTRARSTSNLIRYCPHLPSAVPHLSEAWERISSAASPFTGALQELAPGVHKLLYDGLDLLEAITAPIVSSSSAAAAASAVLKSEADRDGHVAMVGEGGDMSGQPSQQQQQQQLVDRQARRRHRARRRRRAAAAGAGEEEEDSGDDDGDGSQLEPLSGGGQDSSQIKGLSSRGTKLANSSIRRRQAMVNKASGSVLWTVRAPTRVWLQSFFAELRADQRQVGVDDVLHSWFREQQVQAARRVTASQSAAACRAAARTGLPPSERPAAWACALGLPPLPAASSNGSGGGSSPGLDWAGPYPASQRDDDVLRVLCEGVERQALLVDALTCADVCTAVGSEHYFPFADTIRAMLLAFSRDGSISHSARVAPLPR